MLHARAANFRAGHRCQVIGIPTERGSRRTTEGLSSGRGDFRQRPRLVQILKFALQALISQEELPLVQLFLIQAAERDAHVASHRYHRGDEAQGADERWWGRGAEA